MSKYQAYVICTSPRSGSTLLCTLLASTRVAGKPESYFHDPSLEGWLADLGVATDGTETEPELVTVALREAISQGTAGTGIFGLRLQRQSFAFLREKLAVLHPGDLTDGERFRRVLGSTLFVHLTRHDKLAQAISYLKAEQTGLWHMAPDGTELERLAPHREPIYDPDSIRTCVETMAGYDKQWEHWFAREAIDPLRISYDDLSADPVAILRQVLNRLGLDGSAADGVEPGVRKLADGTNLDWVSRFRSQQDVA